MCRPRAEAAPVGVQRLELLQHEHVVLQLAVQLVDLAPHRRRLPLLLVEPLRHDLHLLRGHVVGGLRHVCASKRAALVPRIYRLGKKKNTRCTSCTTLFEKSVYLRCRNILSKTLGDWVSSELCWCSGFDRVRRNLTHYRVPPPPPAPPPHRPPAQHLPDRADRKESPKGYLSKIKNPSPSGRTESAPARRRPPPFSCRMPAAPLPWRPRAAAAA